MNKLILKLSIALLLLCSVMAPAKAWAQNMWDSPFNATFGCYIVGYTASNIYLDFPHYADAGADRYIYKNAGGGLGDAGSAIYYSTDGGNIWTALLYVYNQDQKADSWYWSGVKTANVNYTVYATTPRFGSKRFAGDELLNTSWKTVDYYKNSDGWTHTGVRWIYTGIIQNKAVWFKHEGLLHHNETGNANFTGWVPDGPVVVGNPLHSPNISGYEYLSDGKVRITANITGYTAADDNGSVSGTHSGLLLQSHTKGFPNNSIASEVANSISNHTNAGPHTFTTTAGLTKDKLNSGETYRVGAWRRDNRATAGNTIGGATGYNLKYSENYTTPSYPQPANLFVSLADGRVKLTWTMVAGATNSPTDGYSFQWRRDGGAWQNLSGVTKSYDRTETHPSVEFDYPEYNAGKHNYEFRIKRANMEWGAKGSDDVLYEASKMENINTDYTEIDHVTVESSNSGITLNWHLSEGVIKDTWKYRITRSVGAILLTSSLDITARTYFDNSAPSCEANSYKIEIMDGNNLIREINSAPVVRPHNDPGKINSLSVSKGFYNDRIVVIFGTTSGASFNRYTISRRQLYIPNAIEQSVIEIPTSGLSQYCYEDKNAIAGIYYTYIVRGWIDCDTAHEATTIVQSTGFMQPMGVISGRVAYSGSNAVKNVSVAAVGESGLKNKTFAAADESYIIQTPYKEGALAPDKFTFQAWYKTDINNTTQYLLNSTNRYAVYINNSNRLVFIHSGKNASVPGDAAHTEVVFNNYLFTVNHFTHVSITSQVTGSTLSARLYIDGEVADSATVALAGNVGFRDGNTTSDPHTFIAANIDGTNSCSGYMDELRLWKKVLSAEEIRNNYDRYLSGQEVNLAVYYRFDEEGGTEVFDITGSNGVFNENHGVIKGNNASFRSEFQVPTPGQLAIKAITNENGYYILNTVPYTGSGTSFTITPMLGVHKFDPSNRPLFVSPNSTTHNNIDFTDVSSFPVSGVVIYKGGTYPVEGCSFEIDGQTVTKTNGQLETSGHNGEFTINVPIGYHSVRIVKQGHTFENDGYLTNLDGTPLNYNAPVPNIVFYNTTRVNLTGRVVGGLTEHNKPLGFGESVNNIGVTTITLESTRKQYNFSDITTSKTFTHNNGQWKKNSGLAEDSTTVTYNQENVVITVSPVTGEFVAYLYPEPYNIREIRVPGAGGALLTVYNNNEIIDLSKTPVIDDSYMKTSTRTWTDSVFVANVHGQVDHWEYSEKSDTVRFHEKWTHYYQSTPTFSVTQLVNEAPVAYFGNEKHKYTDVFTGISDTLDLYNPATKSYLFGKPVFTQGGNYSFFLQAYEEYSNYAADPANPETIRYPVESGKVNMMNNVKVSPQPEIIEMDEMGTALYHFIAGAPNLSVGYNDFYATITVGAISFNWDIVVNGTVNLPVSVWHLGAKCTSNTFMTQGPDKVDFILRDPPGSKSKSYLEQGTTVISKHVFHHDHGVQLTHQFIWETGGEIVTFAGTGAGVINELEAKDEIGLGIKTDIKLSWTEETIKNVTVLERIETSGDPMFVGAAGDVFVGNSTNILYGLTDNIAIMKTAEVHSNHTSFATGGAYSVATSKGIAYGEKFDTRFIFTQYTLENEMLPGWRNALSLLLKPMGTVVDTNIIHLPVYVSNLPHNHPNFGKLNTDSIFGAAISPLNSPETGPSYTVFFPAGYAMEKYTLDSVTYFNNQLKNWIKILAQNEKEKINMQRKGNYSFGAGLTVEFSETDDHTYTETFQHNWMLNVSFLKKTGFTFNKFGFSVSANDEVENSISETEGDGKTTSIKSGFILLEDDITDMITVDYGMTSSGTMAFKTLGGQTACPHEEQVVAKYYEPETGHVLSEATMQVEVPKIRVQSAPIVLNVPSNREANFIIAMENESETNADVWFELIVDEASNPYGAILKIDGGPIGNGRSFMVRSRETLLKTLTVGKGIADTYNNIALVLRSRCQSDPTDFLPDIADTTWISVEFVPACTEVAIYEPNQNWILNADSQTGDTMYVTINNFDVNFPNFGFIKLEYRPISSPNWNTLNTYYPSHLFANAQGIKEDIGTRAVLVYPWKTPEADGAYELRATAASVNIVGDTMIVGNPLSTFTTDAVAGYKDVSRPAALGAPSPTNGILGIGDELSITFNEDIQTGMLTKNNFTISGVLNAQPIAEPNVGLAFTGTQFAQTELPIFTNGSFSIETWFKRDVGSSGTLFAFGSNNNYISLGFNASGNAVLTHGSETFTSTIAIADDDTWKFIAMAYDRATNTITVYEYESATSHKLFLNTALTNTPETQGKLKVGNDATNNNGFHGAVSQLHFYGISREEAAIVAGMSVTKSGREYGLIGYWILDEGEGATAKDKARSRHLSVNNADWYIYPSGFAKQTNNNYFAIPTGTYPLNAFSDFTLEFWFRTETVNNLPNQTLFSNDNCYIATNATDGLTLYKNDGTPTSTLNSQLSTLNSQWHHLALSVRRGGSATIFIDGVSTAVFPETQLGTFASGYCYFGAKRTAPSTFSDYFAGYFDEIRIWNSALTKESILLNKNSKLHGDEAGLQAYYPFENYVKQPNGLITVMQTNDNMATTDNFAVAGTVTGFSTTAMSVKDVRPVENISNYTYVASNNKIVFTLNNSDFARVEGTTLALTVKDVRDMRNNKSNTEQWTAFVKRNPLQWDTDPVYMKIQEGELKTFTAKIVNIGGTSVNYVIENIPSWLTLSNPSGTLQPLSNRELTFTVAPGVNIGNYETGIGLTSGNGVTEILPVQLKVTGERPDWHVDPYAFEFSMNITGQIQIEGVFQEDTDDLLGAFIGDLCVGVTSPLFVNSKNAYYTFADIYGNNEHNNQALKFKLWDASTGRIYPVIETSVPNISFIPYQTLGNTEVPVIFNALNYAEQIIQLKKGWTWISSNVLNDNPSILNQMKVSLAETGVIIKGRNAYIQQPYWLGNLTEISEKSMYVVNTTVDHSLILSGVHAAPAATPITLNQGWNWIGYVPALNLPVADALAGHNAQIGDQIKGQIGYATYTGAEWIGSLTFMQPGKGYMYHSGNGTPQVFYYPTATRGGAEEPESPVTRHASRVTNYWTVDNSAFSSSMTMTTIVVDGGVEMHSDQIELGAFCGSVCHGSAVLQYVSSLDRYLGFLTIYGNSNDTINLKVYDHSTSMEHDANNAPITFIADLMFGTPTAPYTIEIGTTTPLSTDATLSNLTVSTGTLTPAFSSNVFDYVVNVDFVITSVTLSATPTDTNATVVGDGLKTINLGNNIFTITVIAQDGVTELNYVVMVNCKVGIVETHNCASLQVYPNPTAGVLNLIQERIANYELGIKSVDIYDVYGKIQKSESRKGEEEKGEVVMDVSELAAGVYFVRINTEQGVVIRKVVKK